MAGVRFHAIGRIYHFDASSLPALKEGDFVVVETTRGRQIGQVATLNPRPEGAAEGPAKPIERMATGRDMAVRRYWQNKEAEALAICREAARRLGLPIKVVNAEYSLDGTRLLFTYTAEDKVDTQGLKQEINQAFRARVEMKLVGPRDVAKLLGGYGACGELRCCSRFLADFSSISIKMAKEQDISLNPQEITGMCGRLRCCLSYEYEQYAQARQGLPKRGKVIGTPHGQGTVVDILPLKEAILVQVEGQLFEVARADILPLDERAANPPRPPKAALDTERRAELAKPSPDLAPAPSDQAEKRDSPSRRRRRRKT